MKDKKNNKCHLCGKYFTECGHLKKHITNVLEGQKIYKCDLCDKTFSYTNSLKIHISSVHKGLKIYKLTLGNLKKHIKNVHERQKNHTFKAYMKNYKCQICDKAFSQKQMKAAHCF